MLFACHNAIVHPERIDGAYVVEDRFRWSHFKSGILNEDGDFDFKSASVGRLTLPSEYWLTR